MHALWHDLAPFMQTKKRYIHTYFRTQELRCYCCEPRTVTVIIRLFDYTHALFITTSTAIGFCRQGKGITPPLPPPTPTLTVLLHNLQELDHDLGARPDEHLPLSTLLSVGDGLQSVREHSHFHHLRSFFSSIHPFIVNATRKKNSMEVQEYVHDRTHRMCVTGCYSTDKTATGERKGLALNKYNCSRLRCAGRHTSNTAQCRHRWNQSTLLSEGLLSSEFLPKSKVQYLL